MLESAISTFCQAGLSFNTGFTSFVKVTSLTYYKVLSVFISPTAFTALITFIQSYHFNQTTSLWKTGTVLYLCFHPLEYGSDWTEAVGLFIFKI